MAPGAGIGRRNGRPSGSAGGERLASAQEAALFGRPTSKFMLKHIMAATAAHAPAVPPAADIPPALAAAPTLPVAAADMSEGGRATGSKRELEGGEGGTAASNPSGDGAQGGGCQTRLAASKAPPPQQQQQLAGTPGVKRGRFHTTSTPTSGSSFSNGAVLALASLSPSRLGRSLEKQLSPLVSSPHQLQSFFLPVPPPRPCAAGAAAANTDASRAWMWALSGGVAPLADAAPEAMQMEERLAACWAAPTTAGGWAAVWQPLPNNVVSPAISRANSMAAAASTTAQGLARLSLDDAMRCSVMAWEPAAASGSAWVPAPASGLGWASPATPCFERGWHHSSQQWGSSWVLPAFTHSPGSSASVWKCLQAAAGDSGVADMQWESSCGSLGASTRAPAASWPSGQHCRHRRSSSLKRATPAVANSRQAAARGSEGAVTAKLKQARQ
jgi:hypothetical protein